MIEAIHISRSGRVAASCEAVWAVATDLARLPEWFPTVERAVLLSGACQGRLQLVAGAWGDKRFARHERVVKWEPPREFAWEFVEEWLDGQPVPRYATLTRLTLRLHAIEQRQTEVIVESYQVPADDTWNNILRSRIDDSTRYLDEAVQRLTRLVTPAGTE